MLRSWRELRQARRNGRRDGRAGVPTATQETLPFGLREILARAEERVLRLVRSWKRDDRVLELQLGDLEQRAVAASARLEAAETRRDAALADHERRTADETERLERLQEQLEELPTADVPASGFPEPEIPTPVALVPPIAGASNPRPAPAPEGPAVTDEDPDPTREAWIAGPGRETSGHGIGSLVYWPLIALIVIGEIPLNAFAFRLFHESDLLTYAMTVTVAVGLVALAHFLGLLAAREERSTIERALLGIFVLVPVVAIAVISLVRYGYLTDVGGDSGVGPVLGTLAFGAINLLVFGAAAGLSYLHHDPRTVANRRASTRAAERERARAERRLAHRQRSRIRREQRVQDDVRKRAEEQRRREHTLEQERRRSELELLTARRRAELDARKDEVLARREEIAEAMRPIRDGARARAEDVAELERAAEDARAALGDLRQQIHAVGTERRAVWEVTEAAIGEVRASYDRLASAYCSANVRAREGHVTPACLEQIPPLEIPAAFEAAMAEVT